MFIQLLINSKTHCFLGDSLLPSQSNVKHQKCQQELCIGYWDTLMLLLREILVVPFEIELFWALRSRRWRQLLRDQRTLLAHFQKSELLKSMEDCVGFSLNKDITANKTRCLVKYLCCR